MVYEERNPLPDFIRRALEPHPRGARHACTLPSAAHPDRVAAGRPEGERPSAVVPAGRLDVEAVLLEALVDLVDAPLAGLDEADVKGLGIAHRVAGAGAHQRQHESVVIEEHVEVPVTFPGRPQAEVALEESPRGGHVVDREVDVVELYPDDSLRGQSAGSIQFVAHTS